MVWAIMMLFLTTVPNVPPPPPPSDPNIDKKPKTPHPTPGKGFPPPGKFGFGPVNISWDSKGFTISGGEGVVGSIGYKFKGPSGQGETTFSVGIGYSESFGPLSAGAAAMVSMTCAGNNVVDVGAGMTTSLGASVPGVSESSTTSLGATMRGGPDVTWQNSGSFFGKNVSGGLQ